jgi:predicted metal-dependent phosphoesterase TrpH
MPAGQPFTLLCQQLGRPRHFGRVDLHLHTTASDGTYSPAEVVDLARRSGLSALAVTDHDTCEAIAPAQAAAAGAVEVCAGVEITTEFRTKELHLLGYFFDLSYEPLQRALERLRENRVGRFWEMVERLGKLGVCVPADQIASIPGGSALGRRHLAELLVKAGKTATVREAFQRYLGDQGRATVPKQRLPVAEAIALVRGGGGVAAWAHPSYDCTTETLLELRALGMQALEVEFPACRPARGKELRHLVEHLGLAITGGSDCHGPGQPRQAVGARGISHHEFLNLRQRATL